MIFSSLFFISVFLPITLALYFLSPKSWRNGILLVSSLLFYAWDEPIYIILMIYSTILDYMCGIKIAKHHDNLSIQKRYLWLSIIGNLSLLGFFKYYDFLAFNINQLNVLHLPIMNLALPIGISFYTFQTMSYTIDVYRGNCSVQRNIVGFGCFVTMFPQLIAGPIVRYVDVVKEIDHRIETIDEFAKGIRIFIIGLGKKVLLANAIGSLWDTVYLSFQHNQNLSVLSAWLGILAFSFQLYFDFSGYSDMAIGMGHMFGFRFPKNFNYPYLATSISDFWRRWHMTLGTWFKEYVYIPLGGNRTSQSIWLRNVFIVWFLTGLWHGANWNYVVWGLYFGVLLVMEKVVLNNRLNILPKVVRWFYTMLAVVIAWVLFSMESLSEGIRYLMIMFGTTANPIIDRFALYQWSNYGLIFVVLVIACTPLIKTCLQMDGTTVDREANCSNNQNYYKNKRNHFSQIIMTSYYSVILLAVLAYLVDASYNPFLYFRF